MGTVWRARDEALGREVAVKEVRAPAGFPDAEVERMYARLEREAWAAARISHRNVITLYDVALDGGRPWIVMELVRGVSLDDQLDAEGPMPPRRAAHIGAEVLAALRAAHGAGVLHRDVKPANVLLGNDGRVVLTDFGIAQVEGTQALTMTGEVVGSPEFLAPERALGHTPGPESDLWSLGVLLYAAVEGHSPFRQDTPLGTLRAVVDDELPPPRRAGALTPVLEGLLRKDPAERTPAARAEQQLRIVGAGGTLRADPAHAAPTVPVTRMSPQQPGSGGAAGPPGAPGTLGAPPYGDEPSGRDDDARARRLPLALAAAALVLLLAIGTLTYILLNRDGGDGSDGARGGTASATGTSHSEKDGGGKGGGATKDSPTATAGTSGGATTTPAQSVRVSAHAVRGSYSGPCPPPAAEAPAFTATITVGRVPAEVRYRWVAANGKASEPGWKTLSFPAGGALSRTVQTVQTGYEQGATVRDRMSVEVSGPVAVTSNSVGYSVTCDVVTPTSGATTGSPDQ
jgi:tRNA A-37 threonylcarbamoyl transferase component Bud32